MFKTVNAYLEPIDIFEKIGERKSELSDESLGFICGLIKETSPRKIVEVGVSAGGTSCVILNCLQKLNLDSKLYSVDVSYTYHFDTSKTCGYQIANAAEYLNNIGNHRLILGKNIAQVIDKEIGRGIDMLILDTTHYLPGELLDFLVCFPYLSQQAVIILDDLTFAHSGENTNAIATKVLYDLIVADKVFPKGVVYPKMGVAFLNADTWKYKLDYFSGLLTPWWYELMPEEIESYRDIVKKQYGRDELLLFDEAVKINLGTLKKKKGIKSEIDKLFKICENETFVLIYGAGQRGAALGTFLKERTNANIGYIISDGRNKEEFEKDGFPLYYLSEIIGYKGKYQILVAAADNEVRINLASYNIDYIDIPNYIFPFIKEYVRLLY